MKPIFSSILFILLTISCYALSSVSDVDNVRFSNITVNKGLTHNQINSIVQDNNGYIWIGTHGGLCRYDGYNIKQYTSMVSDSTSIPHNYIRHLFYDNRNRLWISTELGLCRYDSRTDSFKRYGSNSESDPQYQSVYQNSSTDEIFTSDSRGLNIYDESKDLFKHIEVTGGRIATINCFLAIDDNKLLISSAGLKCVDLETKQLLDTLPASISRWLTYANVSSLCRDDRGNIYIGTHGSGVAVIDLNNDTVKHLNSKNGLSSNMVRAMMYNDRDNSIWIGGEFGINILNIETEAITTIKDNREDITGLNDNAIYSLYKDRDRNIWVGTYFGGLNIHYNNYSAFRYYPAGDSHRHLSGKAVREIHRLDSEHLLISTEDGGLNILNKKRQSFRHINPETKDFPISYHNVHSSIIDQYGYIWVSTFTGGINRYDPKRKQITIFNSQNSDKPIDIIMSMIEHKIDNKIYFASARGLFAYCQAEGEISEISHPYVRNHHISCFAQEQTGLIWIGTGRGNLLTYEPKSEEFHKVELRIKGVKFISSLHLDSDDNIWVCTDNSGLIRIDSKTNEQTRFSIDNGLPSNTIVSVIEDDNGMIWVSTTSGLCKLNPQTTETHTFTVNDGLPTNQFNYSSSFKDTDGQIYLGTVNGMISFYPDQITPEQRELNVIFTKLLIGDKEVLIGEKIDGDVILERSIIHTDKITLTNKQASLLGISYSAFTFDNNNVSYSFKVDDNDWQSIGTQHQILFPKIPMGLHTLYVRASLDGLRWDNDNVCALQIRVKAPFTLSWIAIGIYLLLVLVVLYVTYRILKMRIKFVNSVRLARMERANLETMNRHKIDFFTNISHELKTPLTLILSPLNTIVSDNSMSDKNRNTLRVITKNAQRMLFIIEELIGFSKIEMGQESVTVQRGLALSFIAQTCQIFRLIALENGIQFVVDLDENDDRRVWFSPSIIEKVIYNLLSNAFKFTPSNGLIIIKANIEGELSNQTLNIEVSDTGIGIPSNLLNCIFNNYYQVTPSSSTKGFGIGLAFSNRLVSLHKGGISVKSKEGKGSTFSVKLNVSEEKYRAEERSTVEIDKIAIDNYNYATPSIDMFENGILNSDMKNSARQKILIIEDNQDLNQYICDIFRARYDVISAQNGAQGYEIAVRVIPDIIISDVMMPQMDGFEMTRKLKSDLTTCHIPVFLLTAKTTLEDTIEGFGYGADAYITKPFNEESLRLQVDNTIKTKLHNIRKFNKTPDRIEQTAIVSNPKDVKFLNDVISLIKENISNENFSVTDLTEGVNVSKGMLYLKLKKIAEVSANELIRNIRLNEAKKRLLEGMNISETAYSVGISDPNYFTKCFKKQFNMTPSEFVKSKLT